MKFVHRAMLWKEEVYCIQQNHKGLSSSTVLYKQAGQGCSENIGMKAEYLTSSDMSIYIHSWKAFDCCCVMKYLLFLTI